MAHSCDDKMGMYHPGGVFSQHVFAVKVPLYDLYPTWLDLKQYDGPSYWTGRGKFIHGIWIGISKISPNNVSGFIVAMTGRKLSTMLDRVSLTSENGLSTRAPPRSDNKSFVWPTKSKNWVVMSSTWPKRSKPTSSSKEGKKWGKKMLDNASWTRSASYPVT